MLSAWRIVKTRYALSAFDGEGASVNPGRWNSRGVPVAYASESRSLALLEALVHLQDAEVLPSFSFVGAAFPDDLVEVLAERSLPRDWRASPARQATRDLGDRWIAEARSAILRVPSTIIEEEHNYLINPAHPDFRLVRTIPPRIFALEGRLADE